MLLVLVVGGGLGWFIRRANLQRDAVNAIMAAGGTVKYDFQQITGPRYRSTAPLGPKWLVDLLGVDFFADVTVVTLGTQQTDAILARVGQLSRLKRLDARATPVTDAGLAHLLGLSELGSLWCNGTPGLTDAGLAHLAGLNRLEVLLIEGPTRIEGPGLAHLAGLQQLEFLIIRSETDAGLPYLTQLTGLRRLFIEITKLTDATFTQLSRLTSLDELAFRCETGSDTGMAHLGALTDLKTLQLGGPWLTDAGLGPVSGMDHLSSFFVADTTSVTGGGLYNLQQCRPALRIGVNGTGLVSKARLAGLRRSVGPGAILPSPDE